RSSELVRAAGMTAAGDGLLAVGGVVVGELLALPDRFRRPDPDGLVDDLDPAVRPAAVIDEACDVAADGGISAPPPVDAEYPDAAARQIPCLAGLAVPVPYELAGVVDDPLVLVDRLVR